MDIPAKSLVAYRGWRIYHSDFGGVPVTGDTIWIGERTDPDERVEGASPYDVKRKIDAAAGLRWRGR